jgi:hypothetical protein
MAMEPGRAGSSASEPAELATSYSSEFEAERHRGRRSAADAATRPGLPVRKDSVSENPRGGSGPSESARPRREQSVEAPPGVSDLTCAVPPGRRRPGDDPRGVSRASRSAPDRVAASSVRRSLLVVSTTARSSADPAVRSVRRPTGCFHRLRRPLRVWARVPSPTVPGRIAPPGVSRPSGDISRRDPVHPGLPHPAPSVLGVSHPLDGLLSLGPRGLAGSAAASGVLTREVLSDGEAGTRRRVRCAPSPTVLFSLVL